MKKLVLLCLMFTAPLFGDVKLYIDEDDIDKCSHSDHFFIHLGSNEWMCTDIINHDALGVFVYDHHIKRIAKNSCEFQVKWKCPYCYQYWPKGQPCQNKDCPSKYKS
jgi:hypothetical protein